MNYYRMSGGFPGSLGKTDKGTNCLKETVINILLSVFLDRSSLGGKTLCKNQNLSVFEFKFTSCSIFRSQQRSIWGLKILTFTKSFINNIFRDVTTTNSIDIDSESFFIECFI